MGRLARIGAAAALGFLAGCAQLPLFRGEAENDAPRGAGMSPEPRPAAPASSGAGASGDTAGSDGAVQADGAVTGGRGSQPLGTTVASLGDPADPGLWAETPLVTAPRPGRLEDPATGASVEVELRPSGGAPGSGTRASLPALRALGVPLTGLPELRVIGL